MSNSGRLLLIICLVCLLAMLCAARGGRGGGGGGSRGGGSRGGSRGSSRYSGGSSGSGSSGGGGGGGTDVGVIVGIVFGTIGGCVVVSCCIFCCKSWCEAKSSESDKPTARNYELNDRNVQSPSQATVAALTDGRVPHGQTNDPGTSPDGRNDHPAAHSDTTNGAANCGYPESRAPIGMPPSYDDVMGRGDPGGLPYPTSPPANGPYGFTHSSNDTTTDNPSLPYASYPSQQDVANGFTHSSTNPTTDNPLPYPPFTPRH